MVADKGEIKTKKENPFGFSFDKMKLSLLVVFFVFVVIVVVFLVVFVVVKILKIFVFHNNRNLLKKYDLQ